MVFMNGKALETPVNDYVLECHNLSYIRSFTTGRWYSKIFNPPITAQFLKDVSIEVHGGEVMGIIGSSGSGKTTLLNVIARRVQGTTGGQILLNHRPMTERTFQNNCAYVSFKQSLNKHLTVRETLKYQAELGLASAITPKEKSERVHTVMRDFELMDYGNHRVKNLQESTKRRLLVAFHLVRDPLLILVDEPTKNLDALSSYQLMYNLFQHTKRYNRMAMVTMMMPRSDIYQLFDRMTILFFGEVVYSGYTKQMPVYFRQIGFPCPASENPAIYFLSLATVDRETSERYLETQDQAVKLIEIYKSQGHQFSQYLPTRIEGPNPNPYLPMSHLGRPGSFSKLWTLTKRNLSTYAGQKTLMFMRLLALPFFAAFLFLLYFRIEKKQTSPQTRAGLIFNSLCASSLISVVITSSAFSVHRIRYYQESWDNLYGGTTFILSQLITPVLLDFLTVVGASAIIFWSCNLSSDLIHYLVFAGVLWCCFQFSQLQTMCLMLFIRSSYKAACVSATITFVYLTWSAGVLKSLRTFVDPPKHPSDWLYYLSYGSMYRFASAALHAQQIGNITTTCRKPPGVQTGPLDEFCRWETGSAYLDEMFPRSALRDELLNCGICFAFVAVLSIVTIVLYSVPMPHMVKRQFRFK